MKTSLLFKSFFCIVVLFTFSITTEAQIKYTSTGKLTIGNTQPYSFYNNTIWGSTYFKESGNKFFQIDTTPGATRLASHGNSVVFFNTQTSAYNSIEVQNVYNSSDARAKTNIQPSIYGMNIIQQLKPVTYNFINNPTTRSVDAKEIGLLAQEVETVLPDIVMTDEDGRKLINYTAIIPILIEAVKSLQQQVDDLKSK